MISSILLSFRNMKIDFKSLIKLAILNDFE